MSEIGALRLDDVNVDGARRHIRLRRETTKGKKARCVPLWWDVATLTDLAEWQAERLRHGARGGDPFVCSVLSARLRTLTIHHGRHTFISHALAGGRTLAEVRAAAGHSNVAITSGYLHVVVDEDEGVGELFRTS